MIQAIKFRIFFQHGVGFVLLAAVFVALGQMFWKFSEGQIGVYLLMGFALYAFGFLSLNRGFKYGKISSLQPLLAISFIFSLFIGKWCFQEDISFVKILGIAFVLIGIFCISYDSY